MIEISEVMVQRNRARRYLEKYESECRHSSIVRAKLERSEELRIGAEQQASRAIARLANVVETVRARADGMQRTGMHDYAAVLREMATELQKIELPEAQPEFCAALEGDAAPMAVPGPESTRRKKADEIAPPIPGAPGATFAERVLRRAVPTTLSEELRTRRERLSSTPYVEDEPAHEVHEKIMNAVNAVAAWQPAAQTCPECRGERMALWPNDGSHYATTRECWHCSGSGKVGGGK